MEVCGDANEAAGQETSLRAGVPALQPEPWSLVVAPGPHNEHRERVQK